MTQPNAMAQPGAVPHPHAGPLADLKIIELAGIGPGPMAATMLADMGATVLRIDRTVPRRHWESARELFARTFASRTRQQWCELLEGTDVCFAPVLSFTEAPDHPHFKARGSFVEVAGVRQPMPAPRFSRTPNAVPRVPQAADPARFAQSLRGWLAEERIEHWRARFA